MKEEQNKTTNPNSLSQEEGFDFSKADMDDLVFMYRHKGYGAYQLRKQYARNMVRAAVIAILLLVLVLNFQTIINAILGIELGEEEKNTVVELTEVRFVEAEKHLPEAPVLPEAAPKEQKTTPKKPKVKPEKKDEVVPVTKPEEKKNEEADDKDKEGSPDSPSDGKKEDGTPDPEKADTPTPEKPVSTGEPQKVLLEEVPSYSGGEKEMLRFIYANLRYPDQAREAGIQGTVYITFIVEKDGSISNVLIKQDISKGLGNEAARVVRLMPKWVPGKLAGRPIRAMFTLPVEFKLLDE